MAWQDDLLEQLRISEQPGGLVRVDATGSVAAGSHDGWSDLDVRLTVAAGSVSSFFPETAWLERFGPVFCVEQSVGVDALVCRVLFHDLRRLDLVIVEEGQQLDAERWEAARVFVATDRARDHPGDEFWFSAFDAVVRVVRDDLLLAALLAIGLSRSCLELALHLRDDLQRPVDNEWVSHLLADDASLAEPAAILDHLLTAATMFEGLQRMALPTYHSRRRPLDDLVRQARQTVPERGAYRLRAVRR